MVLQVSTDAREFRDRLNTETFYMNWVTNPRKLQDLWRMYASSSYDDFFACLDSTFCCIGSANILDTYSGEILE
jgi:hypothetical protein